MLSIFAGGLFVIVSLVPMTYVERKMHIFTAILQSYKISRDPCSLRFLLESIVQFHMANDMVCAVCVYIAGSTESMFLIEEMLSFM